MLKSTYKPVKGPPKLPSGWTEHKAPTGHAYYYNTVTKQSTYVRPIEAQQGLNDSTYTTQSEALQHKADPNSFNGTGSAYNFPHRTSFGLGNSSRGRGGFRGEHTDRRQPSVADRPKSKHALPGCQPWLLVKTKLGRRFVHNLETGESFWKFPVDVMRSVVEFDRLEREKKTETRLQRGKNIEDNELLKLESSAARKEESFFHASAGDEAYTIRGEDGEDYEELEVTDDEEDENPSKRQRTEDMGSEEPIEFNEDDIAYQLASMGQDYGLDPGEYGDGRDEDLEDGAEGLTLTESDAIALFKDMLDDHRISPFTTWEKVIEAGQIVEDHRYVVLSNMKSRKDIWAMWSRDKIQLLKEQRERMEKQDPRIPYLSFLQNYATPKLYWPEFRRKYRKEPELRDVKLSDKDREKLYRDYINRLKLPESTLKSDLVTLLKNIPLQSLNRSTLPDALPPALITDLRYVSLRPSIRDPLIETHISTLAAPLGNVDVLPGEQAAMLKEQRERERREKALFDRQKQVEEHKRKQEGVLRFSKDMLREGEQEMERAMKVGKEGLKGYMNLEG